LAITARIDKNRYQHNLKSIPPLTLASPSHGLPRQSSLCCALIRSRDVSPPCRAHTQLWNSAVPGALDFRASCGKVSRWMHAYLYHMYVEALILVTLILIYIKLTVDPNRCSPCCAAQTFASSLLVQDTTAPQDIWTCCTSDIQQHPRREDYLLRDGNWECLWLGAGW
jgi:hypothetical protein